jgi:putative membrane protein insertion efficiency factor
MIANVFLKIIKFYQYIISPMFGPKCRYYPTCSNYAYKAFEIHGIKALPIVLLRILKCNPFGSYGFDEVPANLQTPIFFINLLKFKKSE